MKQQRMDIWIGVGLLGGCLILSFWTARIPTVGTGTSIGPGFSPWLMIGLIAFSVVAMISRSILDARKYARMADNAAEEPSGWVEATLSPGAALRIVLFIGLLIAYVALFMTLGLRV